MSRASHRGMTVIELLVAILVLTMCLWFVWTLVIQGTRSSERLNLKVDQMRAARMASLRISRELSQAVELLHPCLGKDATSPVLVYLTHANELIVLYADKEGRLVRLNRTRGDERTVLASGVAGLRASRAGRRLVNFHLYLARADNPDPKAERVERMSLMTAVAVRNGFN